jgi:hypothetical protein
MEVTPEMEDLRRIYSRLEGGGRDPNLKMMSKSFGVDSAGQSKYLL